MRGASAVGPPWKTAAQVRYSCCSGARLRRTMPGQGIRIIRASQCSGSCKRRKRAQVLLQTNARISSNAEAEGSLASAAQGLDQALHIPIATSSWLSVPFSGAANWDRACSSQHLGTRTFEAETRVPEVCELGAPWCSRSNQKLASASRRSVPLILREPICAVHLKNLIYQVPGPCRLRPGHEGTHGT